MGDGSSASAQAPLPPNRFYGTVTLNGLRAPDGTVVVAFIGSTQCGSTTTFAGLYFVDVDSATATPGCGTDGAIVTFTVSGVTADQTGTFQTGAFTQLNLTAWTGAPLPPNRLYGSVVVDGQPAPDGTIIKAWIGRTLCGTTTVSGGQYVLDVPSATTVRDCGFDGSLVLFTAGSGSPVLLADQGALFQTGAFTQLNLTFKSHPLSPTRLPGPGPLPKPWPWSAR